MPLNRLMACLGLVTLVACGQTDAPSDTGAVPTVPMDAPMLMARTSIVMPSTHPIETMIAEVRAQPPTVTPAPVVTAVAQGPLMREVWPDATAARGTAAAPTHLIYVEHLYDGDASSVFWQLDANDPRTRQRLFSLDRGSDPVVDTSLSADAQWLTYTTIASNGKRAAVYLSHRDGSAAHVLPNAVAARSIARCTRTVAWSPVATTLVFRQAVPQTNGWSDSLVRYDPLTQQQQVLAQDDAFELIGWLDATTIAALSIHPGHPSQILTINVVTQQQTMVGQLPVLEYIPCLQLDGLRQRIIIDGIDPTTNAAVMFTLSLADKQRAQLSGAAQPTDTPRTPPPGSAQPTGKHFAPTPGLAPSTDPYLTLTPGASHNWVWSTQQDAYIVFPQSSSDTAALVASSAAPHALTLMPPHTTATQFRLGATAPNGMYLVVCASSADPTDHTTGTWLYDAPHDRWTRLDDDPQCLQVVGWL